MSPHKRLVAAFSKPSSSEGVQEEAGKGMQESGFEPENH